jgi:hypothetical protein
MDNLVPTGIKQEDLEMASEFEDWSCSSDSSDQGILCYLLILMKSLVTTKTKEQYGIDVSSTLLEDPYRDDPIWNAECATAVDVQGSTGKNSKFKKRS